MDRRVLKIEREIKAAVILSYSYDFSGYCSHNVHIGSFAVTAGETAMLNKE